MKLAEFVALYKPEIQLESYQRDFLERLDQLDFAELEKRINASQLQEVDNTKRQQLVLGVDFGMYDDLTSVCIARKVWHENGKVQMMIIDDIYTEPLMKMEIGHIDGFRFIESPLKEPVAQDGIPEEHMHARRTKGKKKPLPFYHGNRRRF